MAVPPRRLFVGVMSGTSLDGADAALVDFSQPSPHTLAFSTVAFSAPLRESVLQLSEPGSEIMEYFCIENEQFGARTLEDPTAKPIKLP